MMRTLKEFIHKVLCEADEQKAQNTKSVFEDWIKRFGTEYIQLRKSKGHTVTSLTLKENEDIIYISSDIKEWPRNDYFVIAQKKSDGHVFIGSIFTFALALALAFVFTYTTFY